MPQQIPVRACVKHSLIAVFVPLSDRKRERGIRMSFLDPSYDPDHPFIRIIRIFSSLQHNRPESELISRVRTRNDLVFRQAVSLRVAVAGADPAVSAVIPAVIGIFNQAAQIYILAVDALTHLSCFLGQVRVKFRILAEQDAGKRFICQIFPVCQQVRQLQAIILVPTHRTFPPVPGTAKTHTRYANPFCHRHHCTRAYTGAVSHEITSMRRLLCQ